MATGGCALDLNAYLRFISSRQTAVSVVKKQMQQQKQQQKQNQQRQSTNESNSTQRDTMNWIVITNTDQIWAFPPGSDSHLDLTQAIAFDLSWFLGEYRKLQGRISAIRVASSRCSLTDMVEFLRKYAADVTWMEVDTHLPDATRHRTMSAPTWQKVLAREDTLGLRMGCCAGDGKWEQNDVYKEECFAPAILRDVNPDGVKALTLRPTADCSPDFVWLTVLDRLAAGLFPNLTKLTISVCAKHADQVPIPVTVRRLHIYLANGGGKDETSLSAPHVTSLTIEAHPSSSLVECNKFSADGFKALYKLEVIKVKLRLTPPVPENLIDLVVGYNSSLELVGEISSQTNVDLKWIRFASAEVTYSQMLKLASFAPSASIKMRGCGFSELPKVDIDSNYCREKSDDDESDSDDDDSD
jgi:hypothetical protein